MSTSRMARRNLAQQNLNIARENAKGKLITNALDEIGGLVEFGLEATTNNRQSYDDFDKGAESLGIGMDSKIGQQTVGVDKSAPRGMLGKAVDKVGTSLSNFVTRNFTSADRLSDKEFVSDDGRTYTGADISFVGRMKNTKDPQAKMMLAQLEKDGGSLADALNLGEDNQNAITSSSIFSDVGTPKMSREGESGILSEFGGIETAMGGGIESDIGKGLDIDASKFSLEVTGPKGEKIEKNSSGQLYYFNEKGKAVVLPSGSTAYDVMGLNTKEMRSE